MSLATKLRNYLEEEAGLQLPTGALLAIDQFFQEHEIGAYDKDKPTRTIEKFREWEKENPSEDYQYDEIFEFTDSLSRGDMLDVFKYLAK